MFNFVVFFAAVAAARVIQSLPSVPAGWTEVREASPTDFVKLRIALKQQGAAGLEQAVLEASTPGRPKYGQHLTRDEVRAFTGPSAEAVASVTEWLAEHGIKPLVDNDWITIRTTVAQADALLDARFSWYQPENGEGPKLRTLSYSLPDGLVDHIDMVQPTTRFGQIAAHRSTIFKIEDPAPILSEVESLITTTLGGSEQTVNCTLVTPACLKALYNIGYTPSSQGNLVAFSSYLNEYARYNDLQLFENKYLPEAKGQNFSVNLVQGGLNNQTSTEDSVEANLDVQYIVGVSHPIPVLEYSTGGLGPLVPTADETEDQNEPYLDFLNYILAQDDAALPQTLSTSYGEEEQSVPSDYALKVCNMFMQLGARGVSVLFSSGDSGPGNSCLRNTDNATVFTPNFPAGCPYVTAVGGTTGTNPEAAVSFSSGGFSILHSRPSWQDSAVFSYLEYIGDTYAPYFNASGRGIPDVAAQGRNFAVFNGGAEIRVGGTSASSPTFAGVIALLNAARKSQGKPGMGFLNPWLYQNTGALRDITAGFSEGCTERIEFPDGARWNATVGWDPATGLGVPQFDKLLEAAAPGVPNV